MTCQYCFSIAGVVIARKEVYPSPKQIPEGRWIIYEVTLPSKPTDPVFVDFQALTDKIILTRWYMVFEPEEWNTPKQLLVHAIEDEADLPSPYSSSFSIDLTSDDMNFNEEPVPDFTVAIEDNDEGMEKSINTITSRHVLFL